MLKMLKPTLRSSSSSLAGLAPTQRKTGSGLQAIRRRIFKRDQWRCQCLDCKKLKRLRVATVVDHAVPLWAGGADEDHNRQSMHTDCHDLKTAHEAACRARGLFLPWPGTQTPGG